MQNTHRYRPVVTRRIVPTPEARMLAARPYTILWGHNAGEHTARVAEVPWVTVAEATPEACEAALPDVLADAITLLLERGETVPEPTHDLHITRMARTTAAR